MLILSSSHPPHPLSAADISEIESYRSYSPQDDRRAHHSDLSSHSSTERLREKPRWVFCCTPFIHFDSHKCVFFSCLVVLILSNATMIIRIMQD